MENLLESFFFKCYCQDRCECWSENDASVAWIYADVDFTTMEICEGKKKQIFRKFIHVWR